MNSARRTGACRGVRRLTGAALAAAALAASATAAGLTPAAADGGGTTNGARQVYVALGDSMAAGPFVPRRTGPVACGRSTRNYPHRLAARVRAAVFRDVTCSGAETGDMTAPQRLSVLGVAAGTAPPQVDALSAGTTLVTLTIGGNDAGLVGVAGSCVRLSSLGGYCQDTYVRSGVDEEAARIDGLGPKLAAVLDTIHRRSPAARVLVTGYGDYLRAGGCWPAVPLLGSDADWLQGSIDRMNRVIAATSAAHGAEYVDVRTPSEGHDACRAPRAKWVEGFLPTAPAAPLHPNARGEQAYADVIHARMAD
ncbi:SGNH/GDSL hydrolase family protein [Streptomyces sp. NBC_01197]|uniref:SGNH/GDSL hydrolase family protein n=1 Tax=Streptomyces sp. NBC_01197 TaxID=2903768 RepID=UPI002E14107E|nr:SGNH/GDSL hydrolase family protein [Streptomyces sp. NBC_01197]